MTEGILYILYFDTDKEYKDNIFYKNLNNSILSLRKFCNLPITIYTNLDLNLNFKNVEIKKREYNQRQDKTAQKLFWLKDLPYDTTIFIDVDTLFLDNPEKLISDDYDLAICREHRFFKAGNNNAHRRLKNELNTGFFIAKKGDIYSEVIDRAIDVYGGKLPFEAYRKTFGPWDRRDTDWSDQWAINVGLEYVFDITIKILPQKWNVRFPLKDKIKDAKLLHGIYE